MVHLRTTVLKFLTLQMGQIVGPETLVVSLNQTPGNYPKEDNLNTVVQIVVFAYLCGKRKLLPCLAMRGNRI